MNKPNFRVGQLVIINTGATLTQVKIIGAQHINADGWKYFVEEYDSVGERGVRNIPLDSIVFFYDNGKWKTPLDLEKKTEFRARTA